MSKVCGTGSGNFPQPGDPDLSNSLLSAVPAFGGIDVLWTYPLLNPQAIAHTLLYRSTNENPATKVNHRTVTGDFYYDKSTTDAAITYYYWVQHVSVNGTVGDMIGPAFAMARPTIEQVMQGLTGRIDDSLLGQALKAEIASIKTNRQDLLAETVNRVAANGDLLLEYSDLEINLANVDTLVRQEITQRTEADSTIVNQVNLLFAQVDDANALILEEQTVRASDDEALASRIDTTQAQTEDNIAAITTETTARATADEALATMVQSLVASTSKIFRSPTAPDPSQVTINENDLWVDGDDDNHMYQWDGSAWIDAQDGGIAGAFAAIQVEQEARVNSDGALATTITTLEASTASDTEAVEGLAVTAQQSADAASALAVAKANEAEMNAKGYADSQATAAESSALAAAKAYTQQRETAVKAYSDGIVTAAEQAAIDAAAVYARAQKTVAETTAAAYADGIVSDEEARAIADATAKANAAQAISSALANAAQNTANNAVGAAVTADNKADAAAALAVAKANEAETAANTYTDGKATATETASLNAAKAYTNERELIVKSYADSIVTTAEQAAINAAAVYTRAQKTVAEQTAAAYADGEITSVEQRSLSSAQAAANAAEQRASALANAAQGSANQANAAIQTEQTARASGDSALTESLTTLESTLGGEIAQVETNAQTSIGTLNGEVSNIGALYTTKVNVNGLIGGFGVYNDGSEVLAGFDVDTFFVGRTQANKVKPFIIKDGETFIDEAVIQSLTFNKLSADDGSLLFTDGKLTADYINVDGLNVASAAVFSGDVTSDDFVVDQSGWQILQNGVVEINNLKARGSIDGALINGSTIKGSVIQGTAFVALTEFGGNYAGFVSNQSWSASGETANEGWVYTPYINIFSANYSDTNEFRRYRRHAIDASVTVTGGAYNTRIIVYKGGTAVIDTGHRVGTGNWSGSYWSMSSSNEPYEYCGSNCGGNFCETRYSQGNFAFKLTNYPFSGDAQLRIRIYTRNPTNYSASSVAINDY